MTTRYIIACETLKPELTAVMQGRREPIAWVSEEKHRSIEDLRRAVQSAVDAIPPEYTTGLMAFGFCGNSLVGVGSRWQTLVLPRVADCVPLFLGSQARRDAYGPDVYFLTEGNMRSKGSVIAEFRRSVQKYGIEEGTEVMKEMFARYRAFTIIDTGVFDADGAARAVKPFAELLNMPVFVVSGNIRLLRKLVEGDWGDEFLITPPGEVIQA
ncbi:MAG: DUF1638 domain-containing protein [Spirochaetaceae bacterium]|jgi:hypothetical protein|nr:DUF1638 domain-containing protein [Spirochaetaceae bacterium]